MPALSSRLVRPVMREIMREAYTEYIKEHPEELEGVMSMIKRSKSIQEERDARLKERLALIQKCREELENEACNKRS